MAAILPVELLRFIFAHLPTNELIRLRAVSRAWLTEVQQLLVRELTIECSDHEIIVEPQQPAAMLVNHDRATAERESMPRCWMRLNLFDTRVLLDFTRAQYRERSLCLVRWLRLTNTEHWNDELGRTAAGIYACLPAVFPVLRRLDLNFYLPAGLHAVAHRQLDWLCIERLREGGRLQLQCPNLRQLELSANELQETTTSVLRPEKIERLVLRLNEPADLRPFTGLQELIVRDFALGAIELAHHPALQLVHFEPHGFAGFVFEEASHELAALLQQRNANQRERPTLIIDSTELTSVEQLNEIAALLDPANPNMVIRY